MIQVRALFPLFIFLCITVETFGALTTFDKAKSTTEESEADKNTKDQTDSPTDYLEVGETCLAKNRTTFKDSDFPELYEIFRACEQHDFTEIRLQGETNSSTLNLTREFLDIFNQKQIIIYIENITKVEIQNLQCSGIKQFNISHVDELKISVFAQLNEFGCLNIEKLKNLETIKFIRITEHIKETSHVPVSEAENFESYEDLSSPKDHESHLNEHKGHSNEHGSHKTTITILIIICVMLAVGLAGSICWILHFRDQGKVQKGKEPQRVQIEAAPPKKRAVSQCQEAMSPVIEELKIKECVDASKEKKVNASSSKKEAKAQTEPNLLTEVKVETPKTQTEPVKSEAPTVESSSTIQPSVENITEPVVTPNETIPSLEQTNKPPNPESSEADKPSNEEKRKSKIPVRSMSPTNSS